MVNITWIWSKYGQYDYIYAISSYKFMIHYSEKDINSAKVVIHYSEKDIKKTKNYKLSHNPSE